MWYRSKCNSAVSSPFIRAPSGQPWPLALLAWLVLIVPACESVGPPHWPEGCGGEVSSLPAKNAPKPACREAWTGEIVINEVVLKPAGRDIDGDGQSSTRDELLEVVSIADEPVHLAGVELRWVGARRGALSSSTCIKPGTAAIIVGSTTGGFKPPKGAVRLSLDRTLRLTDGGGELALIGIAGTALGSVELAAATGAANGCVTRRIDGERWSPMVAHGELERADGAVWSPGLCAGGGRFPACLAAAQEGGAAGAAVGTNPPPRKRARAAPEG